MKERSFAGWKPSVIRSRKLKKQSWQPVKTKNWKHAVRFFRTRRNSLTVWRRLWSAFTAGMTAMALRVFFPRAGLLFLLSTLFAPLFTAIPSFATAPALIMVGFLMVSSVTEIRFDDDNLCEAIPAYIAIIAMPLFYSISEGISLGIISYVVLNVLTGKAKKVTPLMYILAVLFVLKYIFL